MSKNNREIELKLRVQGASYEETVKQVKKILNYNKSVSGFSKDLYWKAVNKKTADFIRLRFHSPNEGEVTVKHQDKGSNLDRVEIDLSVDNPAQARTLLQRLLGPAVGKIEKHYKVFFFDNYNNVSVYYLPHQDATFIEIEMVNKKAVNKVYNNLKKQFPYSLSKVNGSLFSLYVENEN